MEWLKRLDAPNHYLSTFKHQPFLKASSVIKHCYMSVSICHFCGLDTTGKGVKEQKALGIWDEAFSGGVSVQDVIEDGVYP